MQNFWTEEKSNLLRKLLSEGELSFQHIANKIGCSRSAAIGRAKRMGLQTPENRQKVNRPKPVNRVVPPKPNNFSNKPYVPLKSTPPPKRATRQRVRLPSAFDDDTYFFKWVSQLKPRPSRHEITAIPSMGSCKWITGDVREKNAYWCGKVAVAGTSWCDKHIHLVYQAASFYTGRPPRSALIRAEDKKR